jgi:hypothetical protein
MRKSVKEECLAVCPLLNLIIRGFSIIYVYFYVLLKEMWNWLSDKTGGQKESGKAKSQMDGWNIEGCRGWESEIGGSRPGTEMFGGDYSSRPRPCMDCSAWVDGWMVKRQVFLLPKQEKFKIYI